MSECTVQIVPHRQSAEFEARGWVKTDALTGTHHEPHGVLMELPPPAQGGRD